VVDDQPQTAAAQVVRCEPSLLSAVRARLSVTPTIGTRSKHGLIMFLDLSFSYRRKLLDSDGKIFLMGGVGIIAKGTSLLLSHAQAIRQNQEKGRGSR
jgi:hypothetical protein